jgi:hypothetical protein
MVRGIARRITPIWVAGVVIGSFLPGAWKKTLGTGPYILNEPIAPQHRLAHVVTFGITALGFLLLADRPRDQVHAAGGAFVLGCAIEIFQFMFGFATVFEWWDLRDDAIGIVAVWLIFVGGEVLSGSGRR